MLRALRLALFCAPSGVAGLLVMETDADIDVERDAQQTMGPSPDVALPQLWSRKAREPCIARDYSERGFAIPTNSLSTQMNPGGRLFLVGDEATGHLCEMGKPGLCCSNARPCEGSMGLHGVASLWEESVDRAGWQQLKRHAIRSSSNTALPDAAAYILRPVPLSAPGQVREVADRITSFLHDFQANENDVLVLGLLSSVAYQSLSAFDNFTQVLVTDVVNSFPGRAVLLSGSPTHPTQGGTNACAPVPPPGELRVPPNAFQNALFIFNVWRELTNHRARMVDVHDFLNAISPCHRDAQCVEWNDPTVSMVAQLVLNSLEKIHS